MKKIFFLCLFFGIQSLALCQDYKSAIGVKVNPGITTVFNNLTLSRLAISGGVEINYRIKNSPFFIESGLVIWDRGFKFSGNFEDEYGNDLGFRTQKTHYYFLTLPCNIKYTHKGFYINTGLYIGTKITTKQNIIGEIINYSNLPSTQPVYHDPIIHFGWQAGIGYEFLVSKKLAVSVDAYFSSDSHNVQIYYGENYGIGVGLKYVLH